MESTFNQLRLSAAVVEKNPLRSTPAGLEVLDVWLEQQAVVADGEVQRNNQLRLKGIVFGELAVWLDQQTLGVVRHWQGFLSNARHGKSVVFHIQSLISDS